MGQYWQFINIDKAQTTGHLGKYGEFFFSNFDQLLYLITAPPIPLEDTKPYYKPSTQLGGSWIGDRIICLGDYAYDWPKGVVTANDFLRFQSPKYPNENTGKVGLPSIFYENSEEIRISNYATYGYPTDCVWVLRNLTKKEYVRTDRLPTVFEPTDGQPHLKYTGQGRLDEYLGLGQVLLSRIGWSSDSSMAMPENSCDLSIGAWAGDRFEVRIFDDVKDVMMDADKWKDVSRREAERLHEIWITDEGSGPMPDEPSSWRSI